MKIAINTLFIQPGRNRGTYTYLRSLLGALCQAGELDLVLFVTQHNQHLFESVKGDRIMCRLWGRSRAARILYEQSILSWRARKAGCDILFCPGYMGPIYPSVPSILTVHDMQFRDVPGSVGRLFAAAYNLIVPPAVRHSAAVIAVSEFSKRRIIHHLAIPESKIFVTHEAALAGGKMPDMRDVSRVKEKYGLRSDYLVSVSTAAPHKNVDRLINAYVRLREEVGVNFELVLVGHHRDWFALKYPNAAEKGIRLLGFVPDQDLPSIYNGAKAFALASSYEGFGLPVLEAMQFGLPVACSNCACLPEVAGRAALYFDPNIQEDISDAILSVMNDEAVRARLIAAIPDNLARFSWEKCARETTTVFKNVLEHARRNG
jgi:glycosyltransferase involved in cell wall biosynthesis